MMPTAAAMGARASSQRSSGDDASSVGVGRNEYLSRMGQPDPSLSPSLRQAILSWKYGAGRGVSGTPTFAADGVIDDELANWSLAQWEAWLVT